MQMTKTVSHTNSKQQQLVRNAIHDNCLKGKQVLEFSQPRKEANFGKPLESGFCFLLSGSLFTAGCFI